VDRNTAWRCSLIAVIPVLIVMVNTMMTLVTVLGLAEI